MAYCPHCGKPAGDEATTCVACGKALQNKSAETRKQFKGTLMIGAQGSQPAVPGPATDKEPAHPATSAALAGAPMAAGERAQRPPPPAAGARPTARQATMVGGMAAIAVPTPPAQPKEAAKAPVEVPVDAPADSREAARVQPAQAQPANAATGPGAQAQREDESGGLLVGDPMAPPDAPTVNRPRAETAGDHETLDGYVITPRTSMWAWVVAGFGGMLVIAGCGLLAARLMGLI